MTVPSAIGLPAMSVSCPVRPCGDEMSVKTLPNVSGQESRMLSLAELRVRPPPTSQVRRGAPGRRQREPEHGAGVEDRRARDDRVERPGGAVGRTDREIGPRRVSGPTMPTPLRPTLVTDTETPDAPLRSAVAEPSRKTVPFAGALTPVSDGVAPDTAICPTSIAPSTVKVAASSSTTLSGTGRPAGRGC